MSDVTGSCLMTLDTQGVNGCPCNWCILAESIDPDAVSGAPATLNVGGAYEEHARCARGSRLVGESDLL
jgi:hypothetical protein